MGAFDNAIKLCTKSRNSKEKEYFFGTLFVRDVTYGILVQLWNLSMDKVFKAATRTMRDIVKENASKVNKEETVGTIELLQERYRCTHYNLLFKLPPDEELLDVHSASLFTKGAYQKGGIYLSHNFICFSANEREEITVVLPMLCIISIKEDHPSTRSFTIVTDKQYRFLFSLVGVPQSRNKIYTVMKEWTLFKKNNQRWLSLQSYPKQDSDPTSTTDSPAPELTPPSSPKLSVEGSSYLQKSQGVEWKGGMEYDLQGNKLYTCNNDCEIKLGEKLLKDKKQFSPEYKERELRLERRWDKLMETHGFGLCMMKTEKLRHLLRDGVPNSIRGSLKFQLLFCLFTKKKIAHVWQICAGSFYKQLVKPNYYKELFEKNAGKQTETMEEIERDLHRSFPEHPFFQTEAAINSLRRVLVAYSWHNTQIGYCQSMNIVAALLLLFMPEENVFWMMTCVCEDIVPHYYNEELFGSLIDQQIFVLLVRNFLPGVSKHLEELNIPLAVITLPWLLCLFIGYIPMEATLRTLDTFFYEGADVLFAVGLAIFKLNEDALLEINDSDSVVPLLRSQQYDADQLQRASTYYRELIKGNIPRMRNAQKHEAVMRMEKSSRENYLKEFEGSKYSKQELEEFYHSFQLLLSLQEGDRGFSISFHGFARVLSMNFSCWRNETLTLKVVFRKLSNRSPFIEFKELLIGLQPLLKGSLLERFECKKHEKLIIFLISGICFKQIVCFSAFDEDKDDRVDKGVLYNIFYALLKIYKEKPSRIEDTNALQPPTG